MGATRRRWLVVALALAVAAAFGPGTGAVSQGAMDRAVDGRVADDATAYLGIDASATPGNGTGNATATVTVTNRFPSHTLRVTVRADGRASAAAGLEPGTSATLSVENVTCGTPLRVIASGDGVAVNATRTVPC